MSMKQVIPKISDKDVQRIVARDFPENEIETVFLKLSQCTYLKGKNRIWTAVLKLANGNISMIDQYIDDANRDWRDVIAQAEYPEYAKVLFSKSEVTKRKAIEKDSKQYEKWFKK